nr:unnamed protein product [Callosobruchus chinensis]
MMLSVMSNKNGKETFAQSNARFARSIKCMQNYMLLH